MCQFFVICLTFLSVTCFVGGQENPIKNETALKIVSILDARIVGGEEAEFGQFPHQVSLRRTLTKTHFCGGGIIHMKWILTAAHCLYIQKIRVRPNSITVVAGDVLLEGSSPTHQERIVQQIIEHEKYDGYYLINDIALLQLRDPFIENKAIQIAKMPKGPTAPGTLCLVAGWGYPDSSIETVVNELRFVDVPLLDREKCRELLKNVSTMPSGTLCAGYERGGKDACKGDSGGEMLCNNFLTGIVSGGDGCAKPKLPGLYSDVYFYRKWINSSILNPKGTKKFFGNSGTTSFVNLFWLVPFSLFAFSL